MTTEAGKVRPVECSTQQRPCNHYELNQGPLCIHCGHVSTCHDVVADYKASERRANTFKQLADGTSIALEEAQARIAALEQQLAELGRDAGRLDALLKSSCAVVLMANGKYAIYNPSVANLGSPVGIFDTPREAIDAAITQEKEHV